MENVRIFYIRAVRYSSLSGSRCDSKAVSLREKSEKLLRGRNTFTIKYKQVTRKVEEYNKYEIFLCGLITISGLNKQCYTD